MINGYCGGKSKAVGKSKIVLAIFNQVNVTLVIKDDKHKTVAKAVQIPLNHIGHVTYYAARPEEGNIDLFVDYQLRCKP